MNKNIQLSAIKALVSSFSSIPDEAVLEKVPAEVLKNLESALVNVGICLIAKRKLNVKVKQTPTVIDVKPVGATSVPIPTKQQQSSFVEALELRVKTVGDELHISTPYWAPFNIKMKERLPKGAQRWDSQNDVRIVSSQYRSVVLETMRDAFCKSRRPVYCTVDGERLQFSAGT